MTAALSPTPTSASSTPDVSGAEATPSTTAHASPDSVGSLAPTTMATGSSATLEPLTPQQLLALKFAYTTREAQRLLLQGEQELFLLSGATVQPAPGDIVVARVIQIGQHKRLESPQSRRGTLFIGDMVVVAYGHRYASDQFHAVVPPDLGPCNLVAGGGVAARVIEQHAKIEPATAIEPLGLLATGEGRLTLASTCTHELLESDQPLSGRPRVVAVVGSSMNSGKSTTAGCLIRGLTTAGYTVGAAKVTGTGAGNDPGLYKDSGAHVVLDFTDYGYATTFRLDHQHIRQLLLSQVHDLMQGGADFIVLEIADGLLQEETRRLIDDSTFCATVDQIMFAAGDALGAAGGISLLRSHGLEVTTVTGLLTASPLAAAEARAALEVPITGTFALTDPEVALGLFGPAATAGLMTAQGARVNA